jgi:phosphinothricin acetyltransferase
MPTDPSALSPQQDAVIAVRAARVTDLPALTAIYNHYVLTTHVTFDLEAQSLEARGIWFDKFAERGPHRLLVATRDEEPVGWACSSRLREKPAYATSIETSVYVAPGLTGRGVGRMLYEALFAALANEGLHRAYAGVALPNDASVRLHGAFGFVPIGTYEEVGRKFDRYWSVLWLQKAL